MNTNGKILKAHADKMNIPLRTLDQVKADLAEAKKKGSDVTFARMLVKFGRLTDDAMSYVRNYLK